MALRYRIFSLAHLLVDYAFGAAIRTAYGDHDDGDKDGRDGARSAVRSGGCCVAKMGHHTSLRIKFIFNSLGENNAQRNKTES